MLEKRKVPGTGGDHYIPYKERTGEESVVFFTRDLSAKGLEKIYERICEILEGKVAVKLHTGEKNGPNIIPRDWVRTLLEEKLPNGVIIETNSYYEGDRDTTEKHRETLKVNGWTFAPVDIMDENGAVALPVKGGKWFTEMSMGKTLPEYDSLLALTHFKGHTKGGFGGSNKNIGIGCADGKIGKAMIHTTPGQSDQWDISDEEFMERMTESTKAVAAFYGNADRAYNTPHNKQALCHPPRVHSACLLSVACHLIQTSCGRYLFPRGIGRMMYLYRYLADDAKDAMYQGRMVHTDLN